jgi:hypothetical protein
VLSAANNSHCGKPGRRKFVAELFLEFKDKFLLYGQFCASLPKAQQTLDMLVSKSDVIKEDISRFVLKVYLLYD